MPATLERRRAASVDRTEARPFAAAVSRLPRPTGAPQVGPAVQSPSPTGVYPRVAEATGLAWVAAIVFSFVAASAGADVPTPAWLDVAGYTLLVGVVAGLFVVRQSRVVGWLSYTGLAGVGVSIAYGCRAAHHHEPAWWMSELGVYAALAVASAACAVLAGRRA